MNDFDPTLDEIVSAYVDGEATAAERARVEGDPALLERVATFRRLQHDVAAASEPSGYELQRTLIARALRETAPTSATVHSIRARRVAAAARPLAIAAAIIAALIGFAALVANTASDGGDDSASTAAATVERQSGQPGSAAADSAAGMEAAIAPSAVPTTRASAFSAPASYLGAFTDEAALRQALVNETAKTTAPQTQGSARTTSGAASGAAPCADVASATAAGATVYQAELRGRPVTITVTGTSGVVIDDATCARTLLDLATR